MSTALIKPALFDAHNHLQDARLRPYLGALMQTVRNENISKMVVNGSTEADWAEVLALAREFPEVIPSFGLHPWYLKERTSNWQRTLEKYLDAVPSGMGEIGLDRWIEGYDLDDQVQVFSWQLNLAAERNLPVSIHCLHAWGKLLEVVQNNPRPSCGFVLHSYGGPPEMIPPLAAAGAYFSLPGYFIHERKMRQQQTFKEVPPERLLIETDAPDQPLPQPRRHFPLHDSGGRAINHPANLGAVYEFAAELLAQPPDKLALRIEENFRRLFGALLR